MAAIQTPIFKTTIECPICKTVNEFDNLKVGAYTETGRDSDFCPTGRVWANLDFQKYNPLIFNFATCHNCFYSRELNASYKEWYNDINFKQYKLPNIKAKHLQELAKPNGAVRILGSVIDHENYHFESSIIKILLSIYDEQLCDKPSNLDIARYFVRIAWLFREHDGGSALLPAELFVNEIRNEINWLKEQTGPMVNRISRLEKLVNPQSAVIDLLSTESMDKLRHTIAEMNKTANKYVEETIKLQKTINDIHDNNGDRIITKNEDVSFGQYVNFREFLKTTRQAWGEIPFNEIDAMNKAIDYYLKAYQNSREIKRGLQQVHATYLIAELSRRTGRMDLANEYFKLAMRDARSLLQEQAADKSAVASIRKIIEMVTEQVHLCRNEVGAAV